MTASPAPVLPAVGHVYVRDGVFYDIAALQPSLDGDLVEAVTATEGVTPARILIKASDLTPGGAVAGLTLWK